MQPEFQNGFMSNFIGTNEDDEEVKDNKTNGDTLNGENDTYFDFIVI